MKEMSAAIFLPVPPSYNTKVEGTSLLGSHFSLCNKCLVKQIKGARIYYGNGLRGYSSV